MFRRVTKSALIAVLVILGLLTVAAAQNTPAPPTTPQTIKLDTLHPGSRAGLTAADKGIRPDFFVGWNYVHPQNCASYYYAGIFYTFVYPLEGGYLETSDANFQRTFVAACQTGNWVAFYVYDLFGDYNEVYTYTFK